MEACWVAQADFELAAMLLLHPPPSIEITGVCFCPRLLQHPVVVVQGIGYLMDLGDGAGGLESVTIVCSLDPALLETKAERLPHIQG